MLDYHLHTFSNGIRLVYKQVSHTKIAHCGITLDIGSRDEKPGQEGLAHFWEHMAFKGTTKRKAIQILNRLEWLGGDLNAFTTKEKICFYASLLEEHAEKAVDLLTDITFHSVFPEKEIQKERGVILEEMSMYEDDPADALTDEFDEVLFGSHPLGVNILGTRQTVAGFRRQDFDQFIRQNMDTSRIVLSMVAPMPFAKALRMVSKYIADIPARSAERHRLPFAGYTPHHITRQRNIQQAHCAIGTNAYSLHDERRLAFFMLTNLLGGPAMNSRLNLALREKYGLVYSIDAGYQSYIDTGSFGIYFATEPRTFQRCVDLIHRELRLLRDKPLSPVQLRHARQQIMGQLAMSEESNSGIMLMMGKSILDLERVESLSSIFTRIEQISAQDLQAVATDLLAENRLSMLSFLPAEA